MNELINKETNVENMIYEVRGAQVMLDSDLAKLYHCKNGTKEINQAVKNNMEKFPERFSWKLSDIESHEFLVKNFDQKMETRGGKYKNPRVFTEQGVAMLATIIKSDIATQVSINIMDAFVKMRHYISNSLIEQRYINNLVIKHDSDIKLLQESLDKIQEKKKVNEIFFKGQIYDAYYAIIEIFNKSNKKLIIIDNYADNTLLNLIKRLHVKVVLITSKDSYITHQDVEKYNEQYDNLTIYYNDSFHDRYFILDNKKLYHCGSSLNRLGYKTFSINELSDKDVLTSLSNKIKEIIRGE